jgi:hypothetical protein
VATERVMDESAQRHWLDWLAERTDGDGIAGFDPTGWPAATWVLHSIYEHSGIPTEATYDDVRRARLAAGLDTPLIIGSVNLDEQTTVIGGSLGMSEAPEGDRTRLRWHELATRLGIDLDDNEVPPCFRWFPYRSWPARLDPPDEGSLDNESLEALIDRLAAHSDGGRSTPCIAYYSPLANRANFDETWVREVEISEVRSLVDASAGRVGTPSNWWAIDRTWMVYTDWDLWATKVSGPNALITSIEADPRLECIRWDRPRAGT